MAHDLSMNGYRHEENGTNRYRLIGIAGDRGEHRDHVPNRSTAAQRQTDNPVRVDPLYPTDAKAFAAMLARCSSASRYSRFHGRVDVTKYAAEMLGDPFSQESFGAWAGEACVGVANLTIVEGGWGEVGVLVEDGWQRQGAGSALMAVLVSRGTELGLRGLVAEVPADNHFILPLLARVGSTATTFAHSVYTVRIGLPSGRRAG